LDPASVVAVLRHVVRSPAVLHEPVIGGNAWAYVKDCLDSGWVSSVGRYVDRFEAAIAEFTGAAHAVATVNGTAALHAALTLVGVQSNDEVILPTLTFVATANAVSHLGAIPHFADSEDRTLGLDAAKLERHLSRIARIQGGQLVNTATGRRIAAVVCMHVFGHPSDLDGLIDICQRYHLTLIEDAAESIGSTYRGRHTGTFGRVGVLSFNGNKTITTGGGGAILANDPEIAHAAKHLTTTAKLPHRWAYGHDRVAFNYRLPNINAALGCAQMEQLPTLLTAKRRLASAYEQVFSGVPGLSFVREPANTASNYWLNAIMLDTPSARLRDEILATTNDAGFMTRPAWEPLHSLPMYRDNPRDDLSVAESLHLRLVNLPSGPGLMPQEGAL
jgi:perosamine synthetase